jgi:hypothetical protein
LYPSLRTYVLKGGRLKVLFQVLVFFDVVVKAIVRNVKVAIESADQTN